MEKLKAQVEKLSDKKLKRANKKFPLFTSHHEGYAVIKEELEEAELELEAMKISLDHVWSCIKENDKLRALGNIDDLKFYAINLAAEAIQVSAMCQKFINSFGEGIEII